MGRNMEYLAGTIIGIALMIKAFIDKKSKKEETYEEWEARQW